MGVGMLGKAPRAGLSPCTVLCVLNFGQAVDPHSKTLSPRALSG